MLRSFLFLLCICFTQEAISQDLSREKPDLAKIEQETKNETSPWFYSKLFQRYQANDTALTAEDLIYLYYGFAYTDRYSAYPVSSAEDSLQRILSRASLSDDDYKLLYQYLSVYMTEVPFDIKYMSIMIFICDTLQKESEKDNWLFKYRGIVTTIINSGDGLTSATGMYVTSVSDEYEVLDALGLEFGASQKLIYDKTEGPNDYLEVNKNEYGVSGLYFNVTLVFRGYSQMFGEDDGKKKGKKKKQH